MVTQTIPDLRSVGESIPDALPADLDTATRSDPRRFFLGAWQKAIRDDRTLGRTAKLLAFVIGTYSDPDGTGAFPGTARLADDLGCSTATIGRARSELHDAGYIAFDGGGKGAVTIRYRLTHPRGYPHPRGGGIGTHADEVPAPTRTNLSNDLSTTSSSESTIEEEARNALAWWGIDTPTTRDLTNARDLVARLDGDPEAVERFLSWAKRRGCNRPGGWPHFVGEWQRGTQDTTTERTGPEWEAIDGCDRCTDAGLLALDDGSMDRCDHR